VAAQLRPIQPNGREPEKPPTGGADLVSRIPPELASLIPLFVLLIDLGRWVDAYRHALTTPAPFSTATRVLLARYNLLEVSTYIYRAYQATKKA